MGALEVSGMTTTYGKVTGVDDLSFSVGDGEFFVVLGPSGAGKTTTLKSVAGLVETSAGDVSIAGRDMRGVEPYHRNVAMAFESYALYPQKTVFQNLASPLRSGRSGHFDKAAQQTRIDAVTTTLGINHLLERFPRELSNGQRQRVALGRVLVRPADVYLLDEPLSHLDAKLRAQMRAELKHLGEMSSTTTLYVTHDYQEALALGDRIAVLRAGRLVQIGTPEEIWRRPVDSFVAKALGQPEINLLPGAVADGEISCAAGGIRFDVPSGTDLGSDRSVRVGLRPRDLEPARGAADGVLRFSSRVRLSERLGRLVELSVDVAGTDVIVVTSSEDAVPEGELLELQVPLDAVHLFAAPPDDDPTAETRRLGSAAGPTPAPAALVKEQVR